MKIKARCEKCGKEFFLDQVPSSGGSCPWCGETFQRDYAAVLVEAISAATGAGETLENALEKIAELRPAFRVEVASVVEPIRAIAARLG